MPPFAEMLEGATPGTEETAGAPMAGYQGMTTQPPSIVAAAQRPPATPEEFEARKRGWLEFITESMKDPNVSRALGMMGVSLLQPVPQGQTSAGHFGTAVGVGIGAFDLGRTAQAEEGRKTAESQAVIGEREAGTALKKAELPRAQADAKVATATTDERITQVRTQGRKLSADADKAKTDAEVSALEKQVRQLEVDTLASIPESLRKEAKVAELEFAKQRVEEAKTRVRKGKAEVGKDELELRGLKTLDDAELREYFSKTGRYSTAASGLVQQGNMWGQLYDKMAKSTPDDPLIKGKTRERFMMERLAEGKQKDAVELLIKALQVGMSEDDIKKLGLFDLAQSAAQARQPSGAAAPGQPATGAIRRSFTRDAQGNIVPQK